MGLQLNCAGIGGGAIRCRIALRMASAVARTMRIKDPMTGPSAGTIRFFCV